jgi:hypothetical protein
MEGVPFAIRAGSRSFRADRYPMKSLACFAAVAVAALPVAGCLSAQYKPAKKAEPAQAINLRAVQPPLDVTVHTVIIFQGPGSWKKYALWDEYVVTLTNASEAPLRVESGVLAGAGHLVVAQADPWQLEQRSREAQRDGFGIGNDTVVQVGQGVTGLLVIGGAGAALGATSSGFITGAAAAGLGAAAATVVALPIFVGSSIYRNVSNRHDIEREFNRRRLVLPFTFAPGQTVQGSLFFPITPGPQRLTFPYTANAAASDASVDLAVLNGLHLRPSTAASVR